MAVHAGVVSVLYYALSPRGLGCSTRGRTPCVHGSQRFDSVVDTVSISRGSCFAASCNGRSYSPPYDPSVWMTSTA